MPKMIKSKEGTCVHSAGTQHAVRQARTDWSTHPRGAKCGLNALLVVTSHGGRRQRRVWRVNVGGGRRAPRLHDTRKE